MAAPSTPSHRTAQKQPRAPQKRAVKQRAGQDHRDGGLVEGFDLSADGGRDEQNRGDARDQRRAGRDSPKT